MKRVGMPSIVALACAVVLVATPRVGAVANETPSRDLGVVLQPFKDQPAFENDALFADSVLSDQDYSLERIFDTQLDGFATARVGDFVEAIQAGQGAVILSTHGNSDRVAIEPYDDAYLGTMLDQFIQYAQSGYDTVSHIYWTLQYPPDLPAYCAIGLKGVGVSHYFNSSKSIIYAASCFSIQMAASWDGARCVLGYPGICDFNDAVIDFATFWGKLNGFYGKTGRIVENARLGTTLSLFGNGATVLSPSVAAVSPTPSEDVTCGFQGFVRFDAAMDTLVDTDLAIAGVTQVRLENARWTASDEITFEVHPLEYGTIQFQLNADQLRSANSIGLFLDGNQSPPGSDGVGPSRDDFLWTATAVCREPYPVAMVEDIVWSEGAIEWTSLIERGSVAYRIAGSSALVGSEWNPASQEVSARGSASHYRLQPSAGFPFYRVEELEVIGEQSRWLPYTPIPARENEERRSRTEVDRGPRPVVVLAPPALQGEAEGYRRGREALGFPTSVEALTEPPERALARGDERIAGDDSAPRLRIWGANSEANSRLPAWANDIAIVYPIALNATGALTAYANDKAALGWDVTLVPKTTETYSEMRAKVDSLRALGIDALVFFGVVREGNGPGTSMPATVEPDSNSNFFGFSARSDTILTLWGYEKSLSGPERVEPWVGYVPIETAAQAWSYADKMADYEWNGRYRSNWDNFASWGWDVPYGGNPPSRVVEDVEAATALVPPTWEREAIWGSQVPPGMGWTDMAAASLNSGQGVVLALATASSSDNPAQWLNGGSGYFDPLEDLTPNFKYPLLLALSCSSNMLDAVHADDLPVVLQELVAVPDRGVVGGIGPTRGFYESYYALYARRFWELYATGAHVFVGSLHKAVRNSLLDEFPGDPLMPLFCRLLILTGDPTATLPGVDIDAITGVATVSRSPNAGAVAWLGMPRPNPFNPHVRMLFGLPTATSASIRVVDASGRRVATLIDEVLDAGEHEVVWDGRNSAGHAVGSGIYFFELRAGSERRIRRGTLMR